MHVVMREKLSSTIIDYHAPFEQGLRTLKRSHNFIPKGFKSWVLFLKYLSFLIVNPFLLLSSKESEFKKS